MWMKKGATINFLGGLKIEVLEVDGEEVQLQITRTGHSLSAQVNEPAVEAKIPVITELPRWLTEAFK